MPRWLNYCLFGAKWCGACAWSFCVWTLWLALGLLLGLQVYIASVNELEIPGFVLRSLEERLAASGVKVTFGRTSLDPAGRVLIESARVTLPSYTEPVVTARALYVRLDPWALAAGKFEPREFRLTGATWSVPAMLSPTGRTEEIMRDLDATVVPGKNEFLLEQLVARVAGVVVTARGAIHVPADLAPTKTRLPVAEFFAQNYPALCRQLVAAAAELAALDTPLLHLDLAPSETRAAIAHATVSARAYQRALPVPLAVTGLRLATKFPLLGEAPVTARLELEADELRLPAGTVAHGVRAVVRGTLHPARFAFDPHDLRLDAAAIAAAGYRATALAAHVTPGPLPRLDATIVARVMGAPLAVAALADLSAQTARLRFDGAISPRVLDPLSARLGVRVQQYFDFAALECADGEAVFAPGWKFENVRLRVRVRGIDAYHVHMEEGRALVEFDGRHLHSPDAWARIGENFARGTYDHDLATRAYRFLLVGQLRPLDIGGWFGGGWWTNFFKEFEFPVAPPPASVDVIGNWTDARQAQVFVFSTPTGAVIRGAKFDTLRTRIYLRPSYYDVLEVFGTREGGALRGTATYLNDYATAEWRSLEFDAHTTNLHPAPLLAMIGPAGAEWLAPFRFDAPPQLDVTGRITGPAAAEGPHQTLNIAARTTGEFRLHDFPIENVSFATAIRDDEITVDDMTAEFAGGRLAGRAKIWGRERAQRLRFDYALKDASLGRVVAAVQDYAARQNPAPAAGAKSAAPPSKFLSEKSALHLDLAAVAEGSYADPLSYQGSGLALVTGAELGEVRLLGLLSDLLKFTSLRFTTAKAPFKIDGRRLVFPDLKLSGANSAVEAAGTFALDRRELDFHARVYPLHESGNLIKKGLELVLSPLTSILEVKLAGSLDKPAWSLAATPGNLLRAFVPADPAAKTPPETAAPPPAPPPKPPGG
ncbi:MAG: hypothetical protein RLZZ15_986 [Verrucomicrobiota bacterium]